MTITQLIPLVIILYNISIKNDSKMSNAISLTIVSSFDFSELTEVLEFKGLNRVVKISIFQ